MKNLVYVQTFHRFGSGILFPCQYDNKNACIILTNYHVIRDLKADGKDKKEDINLEFYDVFGKKVEKDFIHAVYVAYGTVCDNESDVAALLVELDSAVCISFDFEDAVLWEESEEGKVYSAGYPNILQEDDMNRRLIIEGKIENTFPKMRKMGIYKITDNYHWYEDMSDKALFEGFSGGPVYMQTEYRKSLIGMNQSLCNIGDGSNPFKLVYFIRIKQVFELLREMGIILFEYDDGKIEIEWIKEWENQEPDEEERNIDILLLGGSGAGKSSFIKELMLHGEEVDASGDGQTTRMDIVYNLKVCCETPQMKVKFYNKENFVNKMIELTSINRITYIFQNRYYFPYRDLEEDLFAYLRMIFQPLELLLKIDKDKSDKEKYIFNADMKEEISRVISRINDGMRKGDDAEREEIIEIYEEILSLLEKMCKLDNTFISREKMSAIFRVDWQECYQKNIREGKNKYYDKITLEQYIKHILDLKEQKAEKYCHKTRAEQELFGVLNMCKGFFDIREFYFLFHEQKPEAYIGNLVYEYRHLFGENAVEENMEYIYEENGKKSALKSYYENLYNFIFKKVQDYLSIDFRFTIELGDNDEKEREIIGLCLKVAGGKSFTSMVEEIEITDAISNTYALMVKKCGIKSIRLIDTCGLDHIERGTGIKRLLVERFIKYSEKNIKFDAVFYLKKLDAGKPAELERILPILYNISPDQPIFNIFTGADIFYGGREDYLVNFPWSKQLYDMEKRDEEMRIPKSVAYFYDNENIVKRIPCSDERRKDLHRAIKENLAPFVSDTEKRKYKKFAKSNRIYLKKLFEAILLDEWNSGYIDKDRIKEMLKDQKFIEALDEDIWDMLWEASLFDWRYRHHMTVNANIRRIQGKVKDEKYMGYNGTYFDRWDCLLREGFQNAFLSKKSQVIQALSEKGIAKSQLERMFAKLKNDIVKEDMKYKSLPAYIKESKFREIFRSMYEDEKCFRYNPYIDEGSMLLENQKEKREYLKEICNFQNGLKNEKVKEEFRNLFIERIKYYTEEENEKRIKNLLKYKSGFREKVKDVIEEMKIFVGTENNKWIMEMFEIFLNS